tara:strand:+ start:298 stop:552 length:255 start_codon:yes stop_codon:yes gene_type:complete
MPKRILKGIVISNKQQKTVVVRVSRQVRHPLYKKIIKRSKKYNAHDESNKLNIGDFAIIQECKPYSKNKSWVVIEPEKSEENIT